MKRFYASIFATMLVVFSTLAVNFATADEVEEGEITAGKEYWFGIPHCLKDRAEPVRWGVYPVELWLSSKVDTRATVESADGSLGQKTYALRANEIKIIQMPDVLENTESEKVTDKGIYIRSDDPVSAAVFIAYKWSGESYRVIPVEWLGKKYYTLNMYQDKCKMRSGYVESKPAQILVVATQDRTNLTYTPAAPTQAGVPVGRPAKVKLDRGQTFLILAEINDGLNQTKYTDLSGTLIEADKPVAVISGHTKGAFPRFSVYFLGSLKSDFMRNMMIEMIWPIEILSDEYVSAPIKYINRNPRDNVTDGVGDLIRFVATEENTKIFQMRQDGTSMKQISNTMKKGDVFDVINQEVPAFYKATSPILVGQYGKSWWSTPVNGVEEKKESPQNPPRAGQGMMLILTPVSHWTSDATFRAPEGMDNFLYLTFHIDDWDKLYYDGEKVINRWGSGVKEIQGTPYGYLVEQIAPGSHYVSADSTTFAGYCYGNYDGPKDGFAHGYPIGINYASPCEDSLYVIDEMECGDVVGEAFAIPEDSACAALHSVTFRESESYNYDFWMTEDFLSGDKHVEFTLTIKDLKEPAKAVVTFMTRSGKGIEKTYEYEPEDIEADPTFVDFGQMEVDEEKCMDFTLTNPADATVPTTVKSVRLKNGRTEFTLVSDDLPVTLNPGESVTIEVCAIPVVDDPQPVRDSVIVELSCYELTPVGLEFTTGSPEIWIADAKWGPVPVGQERSKKVKIVSQGTATAELYSIDWPAQDHVQFPRVENLDFPLILEPGEEHEFTVFYIPDEADVIHKTRANFEANTDEIKVYSDWEGTGIEAGPIIEGYDWEKKRVIDNWSVTELATTEYQGTVTISAIGNTPLTIKELIIENDDEGVFRVDKTMLPGQLIPDNPPVTLPAFFAPKSQMTYLADVTLICDDNGTEKTATAELKGIGIQPHILVDGHDYGDPILIGTSKPGQGYVRHDNLNLENTYAKELLITGLEIQYDNQADEGAFEIDPQFLQDLGDETIIQIGDILEVPITFTALHGGEHTADLIAHSDAPENPVGELIGRGFSTGLIPTDYDYGTLYVTKTGQGTVSLTNTGTTEFDILQDLVIESDNGTDDVRFTITDWEIQDASGAVRVSQPTVSAGNFTLQPNDVLVVYVSFTPQEEAQYDAYINYNTSIPEVATSYLTGVGQKLYTFAYIPKGKYKDKVPGEVFQMEFMYGLDQGEVKPLIEGEIQYFKASIDFSDLGSAIQQDLYPFPENFTANDIKTNGTMTEGWTVEHVEIINDQTLIVHMRGTEPLRSEANGVLFALDMQTYLSDLNEVDVPCSMEVPDNLWVVIREEPGDVTMAPVCVNTLRLIELTTSQYGLNQNQPNPVESTTTISYSVAIESHTNISLFNTQGEKVATLIDQIQDAGEYEFDLNVDELNLSSGVYYYRYDNGLYNETKQMVVTK